jgi:ribonuclease HI
MIEAYFDGCCEPVNPGGTAAYGVVILKNKQKIWETSKLFVPQRGREKETSNNVAEYSGFKAILDYLISQDLTKLPIVVHGDSKLVIMQMFGNWKIRFGYYVPIAKICKAMLKQFPLIMGEWIPREENFLADELSKAMLKRAGVKFRIQPEGT